MSLQLSACPADDVYLADFDSTTTTTTTSTSTSTTGSTSTSTSGTTTSGPERPPREPGECREPDPCDIRDTCECPPSTPVELDQVLCQNFTPHEALFEFDDVSMSIPWLAIEGAPETVLRLEAEYVGGPIFEMHEGVSYDAPWLFDCPQGVFMEVEFTISTDDGRLQWTVPTVLVGVAPNDIDTQAMGPMTDNLGTLAMQPLIYEGEPIEIESLGIWAYHLLGNSELSVVIFGYTSSGWEYQLAAVFH